MAGIERDVIIVGAGPAGAICAAYLAKAGIDVLLLDKESFPRNKACGDMLCEGIVGHINKLEAIDALDKMSTCIRNIKLLSNSGNQVTVPFECYCTPRYGLDKLLVNTAVSWGAEFWQNCTVVDVLEEKSGVKGVKIKYRGVESELRSRLVIGADGASSTVAKALNVMEEKSSGIWLGQRTYFKGVKLDRTLARGQYDAYGVFGFDQMVAPGYFWILPVGKEGVSRGICNVGMVIHDRNSYKGASLEQRFRRWIEKAPQAASMFQGAEQISPWAGGKLTDVTQGTLKAGKGFLLIGDAASLMLPLYNDGLSAAADSAKAAADAVSAAFRRSDLSEKMIVNGYEAVYAAIRNKKGAEPVEADSADEEKLRSLLIESLHDPNVMDQIIERLERDDAYKKKFF